MDALRKLPDDSVDSCVTDPPYELGFMGKKWDNSGIAYSVDLWREVLRVLKPGGHLLSFGGTRTHHRMTCAIEDAGFEVRDCIMWLYGSGFPKSLNVSKAIDKAAGAERKVVGRRLHPTCTVGASTIDKASYAHGTNTSAREWAITTPATDAAAEWEGWGTALKPAVEPICVARKPLAEKTVAANVLEYGTGSININGCRIPSNQSTVRHNNPTMGFGGCKKPFSGGSENSRWPANVLLDEGAVKLLDAQSGFSKSGVQTKPFGTGGMWRTTKQMPCGPQYGDSGGSSRFFWCSKPNKQDRRPYNDHPTVKPTDLLCYLTRLVTPAGGVVLDPFCGSGTTGVACQRERFQYILIDKDPHYIDITNRRLRGE